MPLLDVSDALLDPLLADTFDVIRRPETVNSHGRSSVVPATTTDVVGVVAPASENDLKRHPEMQFTSRCITVITMHRLRASAPGYQPDIVVWAGDNYVVRVLEPWHRYGEGFVVAIAESMDHQDQPVP